MAWHRVETTGKRGMTYTAYPNQSEPPSYQTLYDIAAADDIVGVVHYWDGVPVHTLRRRDNGQVVSDRDDFFSVLQAMGGLSECTVLLNRALGIVTAEQHNGNGDFQIEIAGVTDGIEKAIRALRYAKRIADSG